MNTITFIQHTFLVPPLRRSVPIVFDCGANEGKFGVWVAKALDARVFGYEPDPRLFPRLHQTEKISYYPLAISSKAGQANLFLGNEQCSSLSFSEYDQESSQINSSAVQTTTLEQEFNRLKIDRLDLLKLDIERAELEVLKETPGSVLRRISQITVEFHEFLEPTDVPVIREIISRLKSLGFGCIVFSATTYGDVLFYNKSHIEMGFLNRLHTILFGKYIPGFRRVLSRKLSKVR